MEASLVAPGAGRQTGLTRRGLIGAAASLACTAGASEPALRDRAAARGLVFGAMVDHARLAGDRVYAAAVGRECGAIVPGLEAKWAATEPSPGRFVTAPLDALAGFARAHGQKLRLHTLVWAVWNPPWLAAALAGGQGERVLDRHIDAIAGHQRAWAWDVVNEPADPRWPSDPSGLCTTPWWHALGPGYVEHALRRTHAADPGALLFINDDVFESTDSAAKRATYLRLLEALLARGAPLHGFGLQAHLRPDTIFDAPGTRRFLADLAGLGLRLHVTELDVAAAGLPDRAAARDQAAADMLSRYLEVALDETAVEAVLTWALSDSAPDGAGLLGIDGERKRAWHAVGRALDSAPRR